MIGRNHDWPIQPVQRTGSALVCQKEMHQVHFVGIIILRVKIACLNLNFVLSNFNYNTYAPKLDG
jgi:hypothetical protein